MRGYAKCEFHDDILKAAQEAAGSNYKLNCVGGGKIKHNDKDKDIFVYGTSQVCKPSNLKALKSPVPNVWSLIV